ncbi:deleted in malignant brain tumors 1 protein-like isoform X2 [Acanthaster planci]|uniref:Deleted in malignant brain tumors 1 protein-like isoform X2 n=1 Tax=Acanthaster planci TaxID=133434 RepID=A0A8B7ZA43_ACAPL|nr:deleted in malignant brain tumors 1 protein-like isoform X2 [Acanthaster planci]
MSLCWVPFFLVVSVFCHLCCCHPIGGGPTRVRGTFSSAPCTPRPLGIESGQIPDGSITASSYHGTYPPRNARLNKVGSIGWRPRTPSGSWIQVDLGQPTAVTGSTVQGYTSNSYYITAFFVNHSLTAESSDWQSLADADSGVIGFSVSSGRPTNVSFPLVPIARYLRILTASWQSAYFYLRFEVFGCQDHIDGALRLVNARDRYSGRVEIFHVDTGTWGAVCADQWGTDAAQVVCRQVDLGAAIRAKTASEFGRGEKPVVMNRVACEGTESRLADCPFVCTSYQECGGSHVAGVVCRPKLNTVRLVGGYNNSSGRVEIYRNDSWGTICDNKWDSTDAGVVCRQLGFSGVQEAKSSAHFGQGSGPVHMEGVACAGQEDELGHCPSLCWTESKCSHGRDAGVICLNDNTSGSDEEINSE